MLTRYAPFAVLVSAIMVLVLVAPSKAPAAANSPFASFQAGGQVGGAGGAGEAPGSGGGGNPGAVPVASGPGGAVGAAPNSGPATGRVAVSNIGKPAGDTSHCVRGRQFGELVTAPPCTPAFVGSNGGATWTGVTPDKIEIVYYREKDNPAVKAIEQGIGLYSDPADQQKFLPISEQFINSHYELYGRKVHIDFYQGNCSAAPPDPGCFRTDADRLVAQYHPFTVLYDNNTNTPEFYDQLSRDQTINWGGWHFADSFGQQHRPWHWDVYMAGDYQAELSGEWWCKKMAGKPARFAGDAVLQQQTRKVAVVVPDYPITRGPAEHLVSIINGCAPNTAEVIAYSSDTSTATAQSTSDVAKEKKDGVTSIFWFSDPIAPVYGTTAENEQNYFPEEVLVGSGLLDYDQLAQLYNPNEWKHAFGPSDLQDPVAFTKSDAAVVWHTEGQAGDPYSSANLPWAYLGTIAYILNQTGPNLNPGTFERAAFNGPYLDFWGQTHDNSHPYIRYGAAPDAPGAYAGISDQRQVYWDPNATSPIDGKAGAYISLDHGARYRPGHWTEGEPSLPPGV